MIKKKSKAKKTLKAEQAEEAVILSRVSSRDQEDNTLLETQDERLEKYCKRKELQIICKFQIVESSSRGERKEFMNIIRFIEGEPIRIKSIEPVNVEAIKIESINSDLVKVEVINSELIKIQLIKSKFILNEERQKPIALVIEKVDRLQKRQTETPILDELIKQGKLELHFNSEGYAITQNSSAHHLFMWGSGVSSAKFFTDLLSESVKRSFKHKTETYGEWCGLAPLGYLNKKDAKGKEGVVPDPISSPIIKKIFEQYSTGAYTPAQMAIKSKKWGLRSKKDIT